ncbi:FAD/NAD(P)-binding protein [Thiothrix nivea]|uniref:Oxidoreductase FAD/NAD(P)-binding domain protein n=1 Tax=Thiothrix nivea (strain ATCC 35100 / DSM 5205 / JP2) TaxID=870187 RepID=A0A656HG05_THINJ|nr:FAD/NAD(P)-binding protein [Thiothrix nivea]EIJ34426.1 oxidoreductase FAD/NAD(P)-binding domain protein [Thiothrix nivea DSM 5205]
MNNAYLPHEAEIVERIQEAPDIFTLRLQFTDPYQQASYSFAPGQFNMLYLHGVGEVPISIVSDPDNANLYDHTIRVVGRVTRAMATLQAGDFIGVRGPYGRGWPMAEAEGRDVLLITGGLGCAPVVSVINFMQQRRDRFARLIIMQGVKHANDLIWREQYEGWAQLPNTQILLAANETTPHWAFDKGFVTDLLDKAIFEPDNAIAMLCGPEIMMQVASQRLLEHQVAADDIWLSMERNMHCAVGHCGHCQFGGQFICKDGPVFPLPAISRLLGVKGF